MVRLAGIIVTTRFPFIGQIWKVLVSDRNTKYDKTASESIVWEIVIGYCKVKLATVIESDQKAPFSIATKSICRGGR